MTIEHPNCFGNVTEFEWTDAFYNKDIRAFRNIFHVDVTQSASTSPYVNFGSEEVASTFSWASDFYQRCDFMYQASSENVEFLEFDLTTFNDMHMHGMTVLTKDDDGKVIKVFNGHRNLAETVMFAEHFVRGQRNKGIVSLFHKKALKKYGLDHKFPRNKREIKGVSEVTERVYVDAFRSGTKEAFEKVCDEGVVLSSSYVSNTVKGRENVARSLALMSSFYEHCIFTTQAENQNRTYLLYKGKLRNGLAVTDGFLILVRNDEGAIVEVLDNPIPMHAGTLISAYLAKKWPDQEYSNQYFYNEQLFEKAVKKYSLNKVYGKKTRDLSSFKGFFAQFLIQV